MANLSKSKLIAYRQCPKRLWLEVHRPDLRDDSASETYFAIGHQVGEIAQKIYDPTGEGAFIDIHELGRDEAFETSRQLLESGNRPVFEAAFHSDGALALADVMQPINKDGEIQWRMLEVKSSTSVKDYHRDDAAIQTFIALQKGIPLAEVGLAHINNQFVYPGYQQYDGLLTVEDLTAESMARIEEVRQWISEAHSIVAETQEPEHPVGPHCEDPFPCSFCNHCWKDVPQPENPISILPRISSKKVEELESLGITSLEGVPDEELNVIQKRVKECTLSGEAYFNQLGTDMWLCDHPLPAYFLDFETVQFAVPVWKGTRPYQQLPFQYSLHKSDGAENLSHTEFLDLSGDDPRESLIESLIEATGESGTIYVYNTGFEKHILSDLAEAFPVWSNALQSISERIEDLLPIARNYYYHPSQRGSWGLKAVLPSIAPELSYALLDEVQHGSAAVAVYIEAISPDTTAERKTALRTQLLEYCKLDTLATVKIWDFFRSNS